MATHSCIVDTSAFLDVLQQRVLTQVQSGACRIAPHRSLAIPGSPAYVEAYPHDREQHPFFEWMWLIEGEAQMKVAGRVYALLPGDLCLLPPRCPHADVYSPTTPAYRSLWFSYYPTAITAICFAYEPVGQCRTEGYLSAFCPPMLASVLLMLQNEVFGGDEAAPFGEAAKHGLELQLVALVLRALEMERCSARALVPHSISAQVLQFLREHYSENLSLSDVAHHIYLSPHYLTSVFKRETGRTIFDKLAEIRIERAIELLLGEHMPVQEVARAVGYNDVDHFARIFRRLKGVPPSRYGRHQPRDAA